MRLAADHLVGAAKVRAEQPQTRMGTDAVGEVQSLRTRFTTYTKAEKS